MWPAVMPEAMIAAARRASPGLSPTAAALTMSTSTSTVGSYSGTDTRGWATPSTPATRPATSAAFACRTA